MLTSLDMRNNEDRDSAKRRRQNEYAQDLELQIREKDAAKKRERIQGMNVNASGWLDPEKGPERFKPLGGVHWTQTRGERSSRVTPYHTLFLYGSDATPRRTYATSTTPMPAVHHHQPVEPAYYGYHQPPAVQGSIVQPISMPANTQPIIIQGSQPAPYQGPRFNPYVQKDDGTARELRHLLTITQAEKDRMRRDNEDFQRRLRLELDDERRKLHDQEAEQRRRMEEMRRDAEARRREAERARLEAERLRRLQEIRPRSNPPAPDTKTMVYYDMNDYRQNLINERKKIEELLKSGKPVREVWDLKVLPRQRIDIPPTPPTDDNANRDNVRDFNNLKHRDFNQRDQFRSVYPDVPITNRRLEAQQEALLRQQETDYRDREVVVHTERRERVDSGRHTCRWNSNPNLMERSLTPFPHRLKRKDMMYMAKSVDSLDKYNTDRSEMDDLKLRNHRPRSSDTLADESWLRPSSTAEV